MLDADSHQAPPTRSGWVDHKLRQAILSGELPPGTRIVVSTMADRWDVSPTPLREAIQRLAAEGLVDLSPHRGASVAPVSIDDMREIYELREILEPLALRRSLEHIDDRWRSEATRTFGHLESHLVHTPDDLMGLEERHAAFHGALLSRCDSVRLLRLVGTLAEHSSRYRLLSIAPRGGASEVIEEHRRLLRSSLDGDVDAAVSHLTHHLRLTVESLSSHHDSSSDP